MKVFHLFALCFIFEVAWADPSLFPCPTFETQSVNCFPPEQSSLEPISEVQVEELEKFDMLARCHRRIQDRFSPLRPPSSHGLLKLKASSEDGDTNCSVNASFRISRWGRASVTEIASDCPDMKGFVSEVSASIERSRFRKGLRVMDCEHTFTFEVR